MPVPDTNTFSLQDVVNEVVPYVNTLDNCFIDSVATRFDVRYKGDKDRLSNFRNYGWQQLIGNQIDDLEILSGDIYYRVDLFPDPDNNNIYCYVEDFDGNAWLRLYYCIPDGSLSYSGYSYNLGQTSFRDWDIVDQGHIYLTDIYTDGGGDNYLRLRWFKFDINTSGFTLIDTETLLYTVTGIGSYNYLRVAAIDGYLYIGNFHNSISYSTIYRIVINSSSFGAMSVAISDIVNHVRSLYIKNNVLFYTKDDGVNYKLYSLSIDLVTGYLTSSDNINTTELISNLQADGHGTLYGLEKGGFTNKIMYFTYDENGSNLVEEDSADFDLGASLSFSKLTGGCFMTSTSYLRSVVHDSLDNLSLTSAKQAKKDVVGGSDEEIFELYNVAACSQHGNVVVSGWYDATFNVNKRVYLFSFPIT